MHLYKLLNTMFELITFNNFSQKLVSLFLCFEVVDKYLDTSHERNLIVFLKFNLFKHSNENIKISEKELLLVFIHENVLLFRRDNVGKGLQEQVAKLTTFGY